MSATPEERENLQAILDALSSPDDPRTLCPRCGCCEQVRERCDECGGEGRIYDEDLDDEDSYWADEGYLCAACDGRRFFDVCLGACDKDGSHKRKGGEE